MEQAGEEPVSIASLSMAQRRVLGVLVEKGFTTPEYYPLTLKATTTGCNQKSNRAPVLNYSEDDVQEALDELRELGLAAEVHTDGGRAPRYRHYLRRVFDWSEPQLAIMTELLLRGRQQLGELRSRTGRMKKTDSLDHLREELQGLMNQGLVQSSGPLERRGIDIDHNWYTDREAAKMDSAAPAAAPKPAQAEATNAAAVGAADSGTADSARVDSIAADNASLREELLVCQDEIESLRDDIRRMNESFEDLRRALGG